MASTPSKEFEPSRKYKVILSERMLDPSKHPYAVASVQLDRDLKLPQAVRTATLSPGFGSNECDLSLTAAADGKESLYNGNKSTPRTCALIFDNATGVFTLEKIDTQFAFAADNHSPVSEEQSEEALLNALIEEEGPAEETNPFDWRHQLKRQRTPTPDLDQFRLDTGPTPSPAASPLVRPTMPRSRQASSPPEMSIDFGDDASPEPMQQQQTEHEEFEIGGEESDEEGGLEISWAGAIKPKGFRGRLTERKPDGAPKSLRSAANSRSPAVADYDVESDEDMDVMQSISPRKGRSGHQSDPEPDPVELEPEAAPDAENDEFDAMEAEFERAMEGGDEDEVPAPASPNYVVEDSSSESEEE